MCSQFQRKSSYCRPSLNWLSYASLSIEKIGRLSMPLVWALHGKWPFRGAEHYINPSGRDALPPVFDTLLSADGCFKPPFATPNQASQKFQ